MNIKEKNDNREIILSSDQKSPEKEKNQKPSRNKLSFTNSQKQTAEIQNLKEQLKAKEQQLNNHVNAIDTSNASIEFDLEGNILSVNKNFLEIMGYDEADLLGGHHRLLVDPAYS
jgi:PAS domain-containing protein